MTEVMVIGGGLAGMAAALRLAERGCKVSLYEAADRLGGKAGANRNGNGYDDHGFHIFPGWYLNIWQLVDELGIRKNFVDCHDFVQLRVGEFGKLPTYKTLHDAAAFKNVWRNLRSSPLPFYQTLLFFYSTLDLAAHRYRQRSKLDQISITGFLRSRFYRTEALADVYQDLMLKAISVPSYFVSAMTTRSVIRFWMQYPLPMHRILRGNMQQTFIEPFEARLRALNVSIYTNHQLVQLETEGQRISRVHFVHRVTRESLGTHPVERLVLAIPVECLKDVSTEAVYAACPTLGDVRNLRTRPMASLNLYFEERVPGLPSEHVNLVESTYGLTFIDVSQTWEGYHGTVLNVIMTDFSELEGVDPETAADKIVEELRRFIPEIYPSKIGRMVMQPHLDAPLFMNDVGIWSFRPEVLPDPGDMEHRIELENLYLAGDYCRSHVDLVSMEGAFTTGLKAAKAVQRDTPALAGTKEVSILEPDPPSGLWLWTLWLAGLPVAAIAKIVARILKGPSPPP